MDRLRDIDPSTGRLLGRLGPGLATFYVRLLREGQLTKACPDGRDEARRVGVLLRGVWRASSLVECVNVVARMQQARHRRMTQGLLVLKLLY